MSDPLLAEILKTVQENSRAITLVNETLTSHITKEEGMWKSLGEGWPVNPKTNARDPRYHADWHERDIEKAADRRSLWNELRKVLFVAGSLAILGGAWALLVSGAKIEITRAIQPPVEVKK